MARNITLVFGSYPAGLVVAPIVGGLIADRLRHAHRVLG